MISKVKYIFVLLVFFVGIGCQRDIYNFSQEFSIPEVSKEPSLVQFVVDKETDENMQQSKELAKVADYTKIPYSTIDINDFNTYQKIEPTTRVLCVYETEGLEDIAIEAILNFVAKGGTILFTRQNRDERLGYMLGLKPGSIMEMDSTAYGFHFKKAFLPGLQGFSHDDDKSLHEGFKAANFSERINVLATAANNTDYPLFIENKIGKGRVVLYNSVGRFTKNTRGLLFSNVLLGLEGIPYPVANTATIFLDDYPSPLYNIYKEPIQSEMDKTVASYVTDVWWPDMKQYAKEENIKYTAYVTFDYNAYVTPPFTFKEWDKNAFEKEGVFQQKSSWLGRDVYNSGHELGFHGYNHVSLLKEDWKQTEYMVTALKSARKKWKILDFKALPISYVPPSNYIDSIGLAKLKEGMPSIKYIQSTYLGVREEGGNREFDPDPYNDYFFGYPRITSGYILEPKNILALESLYLFTGIWTHFVHPDDVYQIPSKSNEATSGHYEYRNKHNLNWRSSEGKKGLFDRFKEDLASFKQRHPMVRYLNATESSNLVKDWRYAYFSHIRDDGYYTVESDYQSKENKSHYWFLYVSDHNAALVDQNLGDTNAQIKKTPFLNGNMYSIETNDALLKLPDLYLKGKGSGILNSEALANVEVEYLSYKESRDILVPLVEQVLKYVGNGELRKATDLIETNIENGTEFDEDQWLSYADYLVWQERGDRIWKVLEKEYQKKESKKLAFLSRNISTRAGYPDNETRENWLTRQIIWGTEDVAVLSEYVDYFNTVERKKMILQVLRQLTDLEPSALNSKRYITHLINNNFEGVVPELNNVPVCDEFYHDMAREISWAYADRFRYDKALAWSKCSEGIEAEAIDSWLINSNSFDELKKVDYHKYLDVLLANNPKRALREILQRKPCAPDLKQHAKAIANAYASFNLYREALRWSKCDENVPITSKMNWLYELRKYTELRELYNAHIEEHPEDYEAKLRMSALLLFEGDVASSAEITATLPNSVEDRELRTKINLEAKNLGIKEQRQLVKKHEKLLYSNVRKDISKNLRMEEGNSVSTNSYAINDRFDPNTIGNVLSYNMYDKKFNVHSFSGTQSFMYPVNFTSENNVNTRRDLLGFEYRFKSSSSNKKGYSARARLERDNANQMYYQVGFGFTSNGESTFNSLGLDYFPVRSGPGHILEIYRTQLANYNEFQLTKQLKQIASFEGNYYTDNQGDITLLSRTEYVVAESSMFRVSPLLEVSYGLGTTDRRDGYPYWMADKRAYGGGGLALGIGSEKSAFQMIADASIFGEIGQPSFERYTGNLSYRIKDFTIINAGFEVYTIENFYSNVFQLGMVYNFK